jgi:hypothetical protein
VTITPKAAQPTATATQAANTNQPNGNSSTNTPIPTSTTITVEANTDAATTGVSEVSALEAEKPQEIADQTASGNDVQAQDEAYPATTATTTAVTDTETGDTYPNNTAIGETTNAAAATPMPVIGGSQENDSQQTTDSNANEAAQNSSSNQGRLFLWLGFVDALLIFITGLIGSIILFTRKSK